MGFVFDYGDNKCIVTVQQEYKNTALLLSKYRENPSRYCKTVRTGCGVIILTMHKKKLLSDCAHAQTGLILCCLWTTKSGLMPLSQVQVHSHLPSIAIYIGVTCAA